MEYNIHSIFSVLHALRSAEVTLNLFFFFFWEVDLHRKYRRADLSMGADRAHK